MLRVYANNNLLGADWLLGQEEGDGGEMPSPSGDGGEGGFSLSDIGKYASKAQELAATGKSIASAVTGGGTKAAGAKPSSADPYWRCAPMKDARSKAQCRYEVDRAIALRKRATSGKKPASSYLLWGLGIAAVGGAAWWFLK